MIKTLHFFTNLPETMNLVVFSARARSMEANLDELLKNIRMDNARAVQLKDALQDPDFCKIQENELQKMQSEYVAGVSSSEVPIPEQHEELVPLYAEVLAGGLAMGRLITALAWVKTPLKDTQEDALSKVKAAEFLPEQYRNAMDSAEAAHRKQEASLLAQTTLEVQEIRAKMLWRLNLADDFQRQVINIEKSICFYAKGLDQERLNLPETRFQVQYFLIDNATKAMTIGGIKTFLAFNKQSPS